MKMAMITPGYLPVPAVNGGAVEVLIEELIRGNENYRQYNIDLYTVNDEKLNEYNFKYTKIIQIKAGPITKIKNKVVNEIYKLLKIKKWRTSFSRELVKKIKKEKYDLIVFHNNLMAYRDVYGKTNNKDNLVYVAHNNANDGDVNHIKIVELIGRTAKKVLTVSQYTMNDFKKIAPQADINVFYNCIDLEKYAEGILSTEIEKLKKQYKIEKDDFVFMYSGRIDIYKGVLELVKAFKTISKKNTKLLIVGKSWFSEEHSKDKYTEALMRESEEIKDRVIFTGFVLPKDMPKMYRLADCLIVPSIWEEPFGVVALEGMASKLPLIVTNSGGLTEIVDNECAFVVDKSNALVEQLTAKMDEISNDVDLATKMGQYGMEKVLSMEKFDNKNYYQSFCKKMGI